MSRVNLPFVNQSSGVVESAKLPVLAHWNRNSSIETVLVEIRRYVFRTVVLSGCLFDQNYHRREMGSFNNRKLPQPPEGSMF